MAKRWRIRLNTALVAAMLITVLATAALIHVPWSLTARDNVRTIVGQLNGEIIRASRAELADVLANAEAVQEALRTIFFQDVIATTNAAKREFVFLALLQSQPSLSWVAIGWPDGRFFGAHKRPDGDIHMVEVAHPPGDERRLRIDRYRTGDMDIWFQERRFQPSDFDATDHPWYQAAQFTEGRVWTAPHGFPDDGGPALAVSSRLFVYREYVGVILAAMELDRLSDFLAGLDVGDSGTVFVANGLGRVQAWPGKAMDVAEGAAHMPDLMDLDSPLLAVASRARAAHGIDFATLAATRTLNWSDPETGADYFVTFAPMDFKDWVIGTVIPARDFLAPIERNTTRLTWALIGLLVVAAAGALVLVRLAIARPLANVTGQLRHIETLDLGRVRRVPSRLRELDELSSALVQMGRGLESFQRYLPADLVRTLVARGVPAEPGGQWRPLTLMFMDLAGFTGLAERLGDRVVPVLATYLETMSREIMAAGGTVDKFIGDGIMAFWNAPADDGDHAVHACRAALACQAALADFTGEAAGLGARIGLNTGTVLVGNIGSAERLNYTAVGDPVNVAARLEPLNKRYGTGILLSKDTSRAAGAAIVTRRLDTVAVYGRAGGVAIHELLGMAEDTARPDWVDAYEQGLDHYAARQWHDAIAAFSRARDLRGGDRPADLFIDRCRALAADPPGPDWTPATVMDTK